MVDPLETLKARLAAALVPEADDCDTPERARARKALGATFDYLREIGIPLELRADLHKLYAALEDVAVGRSNPLLERKPAPPDMPKKKTFDQSQETMAAAAVTILVNGGWDLEAAASFVATGLRLDRRALLDYRKNLTARRIKGDALNRYSEWLRDHKTYGMTATEHVKTMIATGGKFSKV